MDLSIIIVNYKTKGFTLSCLKSIYEADLSGVNFEVIVVDNNSEDNSPQIIGWQYPQVKLIESKVNLGMGGGNNLGMASAKGRYWCVMNPDTLVFKDTFKSLIAFMDKRPDIGVVGPKQYNPDHSVQDSCYRWYGLLTPLYRRTGLGKTAFGRRDLDRFLMADFNKQSEQEVNWLLGSFLFMKAEAVREIGGFDERFFLYFEDTDLCRRFWQHGFKVVYNPAAEIIHNHNRASAKTPWYKFFTSKSTRIHIYSWIKYSIKWCGK